jgi:dienelactone hydrolase
MTRRLLITAGTALALAAAGTVPAMSAAAPSAATAESPAASRSLPVVREGDPQFPGFTVYRPQDLANLGFRLPIVTWENGGCSQSNASAATFLTRVAAAGFLVIAKGEPDAAGEPLPLAPEQAPSLLDGGPMEPHRMTAVIDQAIAENSRPGSPYFHRLAVEKIAATGYSCGGVTSFIVASWDDRVRSVLAYNSATDPKPGDTPQRSALSQLNGAAAWINGGPTDIAYPGGESDWAAAPPTLPAFQARHLTAGHTGFWQSDAFQLEVALIGIHWLDFTLNGNPQARAHILGDPCGFCDDPMWTARAKNWHSFAPPSR